MKKKAKKVQDGGFDAMLKQNAAAGTGFVIFSDKKGVAALSPKANPTREDFIQGWMKYPGHRPTHRHVDGTWVYAVTEYTREEAEARVDRYLASIRGSGTE